MDFQIAALLSFAKSAPRREDAHSLLLTATKKPASRVREHEGIDWRSRKQDTRPSQKTLTVLTFKSG